MKETIRLRPHHLLCHRLFSGNGYNEAFVSNTRAVIARLETNPSARVEVSPMCDDICAACPHNASGRCNFGASVDAKDASIAAFLHVPTTCHMSARHLNALLAFRLKKLDSVAAVCGECEWSEMCDRQLAIVKSRR